MKKCKVYTCISLVSHEKGDIEPKLCPRGIDAYSILLAPGGGNSDKNEVEVILMFNDDEDMRDFVTTLYNKTLKQLDEWEEQGLSFDTETKLEDAYM